MVAPALLKRAFGKPEPSKLGVYSTGCYEFEDSNLDLFRIYDWKTTIIYHGLNRLDEDYYFNEKNMKKPEHKRKKPQPLYEEFWASNEPHNFKVLGDKRSQYQKFRKWLRRHLRKIEEDPSFDYDKIVMEKWEDKMDICLGDYNEKGVINTEMAVYKWTNQIFMTPDEIKKLKPEQKLEIPVPPVAPDFSKAERFTIDKESMDLEKIQTEQENLSNFI